MKIISENPTKNAQIPWLDRPLTKIFPAFTIEMFIFCLIVALTAASRLYDLGVRVISHDESLHTYFSWLLYRGGGYQHNPMMHGPLQFHLLALTYFLFGVSDFTARLPHAISSILTIILLWQWRRYLGRSGALVAAGFMLISPFMLYYGRYARNEAFVGLIGVLTLYAILRYLETSRPRYLYLLTLATVLHFATKETAFIYTAQALLFLAIHFIGRIARKPWKSTGLYNSFLILFSMGILLVGITMGLAFYNRSQDVGASEPLTPLVPEATLSPFAAPFQGLAPTSILLLAAIVAFGIAVVLLILGYGWKQIRAEQSFDMLILLGTLVLPHLAAFPIKALGWNPLDYNFTWTGWNASLLQQGLARSALVLIPIAAVAIAIGLWWNRSIWIKCTALFYSIFTVLYTTVFTNGDGFFSGLVGSLGYWLVQQEVRRGGQPWYYYLAVQIPIYEFLPFIGAMIAIYFGVRRKNPAPLPAPTEDDAQGDAPQVEGSNNTFALLVWWSFSSLFAFTIAGEKMPWLTFHIALPMILLSGWGIGQIIERTDWEFIRKQRGLLLIALLLMALISFASMLFALLGATPPFQGKELAELRATASFLLALLAFIGSMWGIVRLIKSWNLHLALRLVLLTMLALLVVLTGRAAYRAAYIEYDNGTEYLVYAHGARGIKDIMEQVDEISKRISGGYTLAVAYDVSSPDTGVSWPFTWYLRDYTNTRPFDQPTRTLRDSPVIIVDQKNFGKIETVVGQAYYRFDYLRMVWPNQDYWNLTWTRIWEMLKSPQMRAGIFNIWLNRDYAAYAEATGSTYFTLPTWEPSDKMRLYIRKDIAAQIWNYGLAPTTVVEADPYEKSMLQLPADKVVGAPGGEQGQLEAPRGIAIAPDGSLYVADSRNHRIQRYSADGVWLDSWGTFSDNSITTAPLGTFYEPWGVAVSPDGNWIYVTDTWNHRVQKFTAEGLAVNGWGHANYGQTSDTFGFWGPRGIAVDAQGRVLVADTGNKRIVIFDADGTYLGQFGTGGMDPGQFDEPVGIAIDANGIVYVTDTWNQRVQAFLPGADGITYMPYLNWEISGWYGQSLDNKPFIAACAGDQVFVTDPEASRILQFSSRGEFIRTWGEFGVGITNIGLASGIACDAAGHIWVSDTGNNRLMQFTLPVTENAILPSPSDSPAP